LKEAIIGRESARKRGIEQRFHLLCQVVMQSKFVPLLNSSLQTSIRPHALERLEVFNREFLSVIEVAI
jgi:hypothetical protein